MLIKAFFGPERCSVLVAAPRCFRKLTNMDMIKHFSEIVMDDNGLRVAKKETVNFRDFTDKYNKVDGTKVVL